MASIPTRNDVIDALRPVQDPELHKSLVDLGMIQNVAVDAEGAVNFKVELTTPACPLKDQIRTECEAAVRAVEGVTSVNIDFGAQVKAFGRPQPQAEGVKNIILVASGKGGVGKSTVAVNLAAALHESGAKTGLLDADVYGPSIPIMMGAINERPRAISETRMAPVEAHGLKLMSIGFLVDPETAMVWRGPMLSRAVEQFVGDVEWGELDYLVLDLPPGTGDVQLTLAQKVAVAGAVIVTTPQVVALADVIRAKSMFDKVNIPILGLVENMSRFICPGCGDSFPIFDQGGGIRAAEHLGVDFLGDIPIDPEVRKGGDNGVPLVLSSPESLTAEAFRKVAGQMASRLSIRSAAQTGFSITEA